MFDTETLNHEPPAIVQQLLIDAGLGADPDDEEAGAFWVYSFTEPAVHDRTITVLEASGVAGPRDMITGSDGIAHGIQFRVRGRTSQEARGKARDIRKTILRNVCGMNVTLDGDIYRVHSFSEVGPVIDLGFEGASENLIYTLNALVTLRMV